MVEASRQVVVLVGHVVVIVGVDNPFVVVLLPRPLTVGSPIGASFG